MTTLKTVLLAAAALMMAGAATTSGALAETRWDANHPARAEVNHRLHTQAVRIREERREGEISGRRARFLHAQDRHIRHEERRFARYHGGHITRAEQARLNHQENHVSREIGR